MRHRNTVKKLGRDKSHRDIMVSNLASDLILNEYIVTTVAKAKACKSYVDRVISTAKNDGLASQRKIEKLLRDKLASDKVVKVLKDRFKDRVGGFTTSIRIGRRKGDNAQMMKLVLIGSKAFKDKKVKVSKSKQKKSVGEKDKDKVAETKRKSILDRVKGIGGRIGKVGSQTKKEKKDQIDGSVSDVKIRSRSGI